MKIFYTERDIVDKHNTGVTEIEVADNVVLTDLAREKAVRLGIRLVNRAGVDANSVPPVTAFPANNVTHLSEEDLVARLKARVIAKLGTTQYNNLLDQVIPQVLARLTDGNAEDANS